MLQELLKEFLGDDAKVTEFLNKMKENKIFTASEENLDTRYSKLSGEYEALKTKNKESLDLIEQMKKSTEGNEDLQGKIADYENKIAELEKQNQELAVDNAIKFELLSKGAKASDIDYLIFKIKQGETELKLDKDGNVKGLDGLVDEMKKNYSSNFEDKAHKKVDVKKLPDDGGDDKGVTKEEFLKKPYAERVKFAQENQEAFNAMFNE